MPTPSDRLSLMIEAARIAGRGLATDFARLSEIEVRLKGPSDFVSEADLKAEDAVRETLARAGADYGFIGEETGETGVDSHDDIWIVDPLDGTINFLRGTPLFAVNIALASNGQVVAAVTFNPIDGELYWAERGCGAYLGDRRIHTAATSDPANAVVAVGMPSNGKQGFEQAAAELAQVMPVTASMRRLGSAALDIAYVAAGRFDAFWERSLNSWDMAAGVLLVEEAGGIVTDADGEPLNVFGHTICAAAPGFHAELIARLHAARDAICEGTTT